MYCARIGMMCFVKSYHQTKFSTIFSKNFNQRRPRFDLSRLLKVMKWLVNTHTLLIEMLAQFARSDETQVLELIFGVKARTMRFPFF